MYKIFLSIICLGLLGSCASQQPEYIDAPTPVSQIEAADEQPSHLI